LLWARQYDGVIEESRKALEIDPNFWVAHLFLGKAYEQKGMYPEAFAALRKAKELSGGSSEATSMIGYVYAVSGRRDEAVRVLADPVATRLACVRPSQRAITLVLKTTAQ